MKNVVVITGDSSGMGADLAKMFSSNSIVYGISRRPLNSDYKHYQADVLDYDKLKEIIDEIYNTEGHIDILIASSGLGVAGAVELMDIKDINYQLNVNFNGVINIDKAVIPYMRNKKSGKIIHVSSVAAVAPMPFQAMYSASKAAINSYSMALANELKPFGITVTSVMPGDTLSGFTSARKKVFDENSLYDGRVERSITKMENDELQGTPSIKVSTKIYKIIMKKKPKVLYTIGASYKFLVFLMKILPSNFVNKILYKIYAK